MSRPLPLAPTRRCLLFTRFPRAGLTKTRLIPCLGPAGAANLQQKLTERTAQLLAALPAAIGREVWYTGGSAQQMQAWLGRGFSYHRQVNGDLGARLFAAFASARRRGAKRMVLIGADCPTLTTKDIERAFHLLEHSGLVIGPAQDGGYYLLGLRASAVRQELFCDIPWGSHQVLATTLAAAAGLNIKTGRLPVQPDIDRPADLMLVANLSQPKAAK